MRFVTIGRRFLRSALVLPAAATLAILAGCSSPPPPPPPTIVNLTLTTSADANPTASGQGAPLVLRVYQLASPAGFENAEFFRLYNQDTATLGADLLKKDEYLMAPGTSKTVKLEPSAAVKSVGVFAAYRDFRNATWRGTAEVSANKTTDVTVAADAKGITVKAAPAPAPPAR